MLPEFRENIVIGVKERFFGRRFGRIAFFFCFFSVLLLSSFTVWGLSSEPEAVGGRGLHSPDVIIVKAVCELIGEGKFEVAGDLIRQTGREKDPKVSELAEIVDRYSLIEEQRRAGKAAAYNEQLAELEKLEIGGDVNEVNDVNDPNGLGGISKALSVIAKASEFADEKQKEELFSRSFVKETISEAIKKANEFESKGKWLDSYMVCYSWLAAIEPDNEAYSDYAEQLLDKANIVASFQDSPCETSEQRYEGVQEEMFIRAMKALHFNYVNIIDYREMLAEAIERCSQLAEVMSLSYDEIKQGPGNAGSFSFPESGQLAAWYSGLGAILEEVKQSPAGVSKDRLIEVFKKVLKLNKETVGLPETVLISHFSEASLFSLDPYTMIVWPRQVQDFEKLMTNEFTGIGVEISKRKGLLTVSSLLPDTPAYYSGLDAGDVIEEIDGLETKEMSITCAVRNITGPAKTKVTLTVKGPGSVQRRDITITRGRITVPTIRGWKRTESGKWLYMIDESERIGYARLTSFSERTASDLERVLDELERQGLRGFILDLRFNSGGLLDSAVDVADKFLREGLIVRTQPRFGIPTWASAKAFGTHPGYPLVVLMNSSSASASEIVAGALADPFHRRAILVGERTHGKGSVQSIAHYPGNGAQLKYTMAYYHLPSGQRVESQDAMKKLGREDWGISPAIELKLRSDELRKMFEVQRDNDVLVKADHDKGSRPLKKHTVEETLEADAQLAVAVLVLKSRLIETKVLAGGTKRF